MQIRIFFIITPVMIFFSSSIIISPFTGQLMQLQTFKIDKNITMTQLGL